VNNQLERKWKKTMVAKSRVLHRYLPGRTEESSNHIRIIDGPTENKTGHLPNNVRQN